MTIPNQPTRESTTISRSDEDMVETMNPTSSPKLLKNSAARQSCCIFRIPHTLAQVNETAYKPKLVSIGPYHHGEAHCQMIEEHKQRYLDIFLSKTAKNGVGLEDLQNVVAEMEHMIRDSYSEDLDCNREELINMMVHDGCFILMLFLAGSKKVRHKTCEDPLFMLRLILPTLRSDLLLLENQVPLLLLRNLLKTSKLVPNTSLNEVIFKFFSYSIIRPKEFWNERKDLDGSHLLDLIRKTFIPNQSPQQTEGESRINILCGPKENTCFDIMSFFKDKVQEETPTPEDLIHRRRFLKLIVSARKLQLRGIKFMRKDKFDTPLDITLKNGVLEIPTLTFDDFFSSLLINCVAFEQFNMNCSTEMTSYVTFMGCLMNSQEDATFLSEKGIIENYFGTAEQVSLFFKNTGKDISFSISKSFLSNVFEGVNKYTSQGYHVQWAGFKYTHFNSPWTFLSSCAALLLILLTIIQAFFAAYAYFRPPG